MPCEHGYIERQNADMDGMCVLCQQAEIKHLNDQIHTLLVENELLRVRLGKWEDVSNIPQYSGR
jgi:hypothetical protein